MINGGGAADHLFIADNGLSCQSEPDDMNLPPPDSFITLYQGGTNDPMMISLRRVQTTQTPRARRLAANCLILSDVKEMRDGFSQRLIIPMNSVTIPIWPRASDRNGRRSCGGGVGQGPGRDY